MSGALIAPHVGFPILDGRSSRHRLLLRPELFFRIDAPSRGGAARGLLVAPAHEPGDRGAWRVSRRVAVTA